MKLAAAEVPPAWMREGKRSARALLRAELAALKLLRSALETSTAPALAALGRLQIADRRAAAETASGLLKAEFPRLQHAFEGAIADGRLGSKRGSLDRLQAEWERVRAEVRRARLDDPGPLHVHAALTPTDQARVVAAAAPLAAGWLAGTVTAVWAWAENDNAEAPLGAAAYDAQQALDPRLRRTAATEAATAFSDARDEGMGWVAERHAEARWFPALLKIWDASNDRKICPRCAGLDGSVKLYGLPFPGGQEPGYVHPFCRCITGTLFLPARIRGETEPGHLVDDERPREAA